MQASNTHFGIDWDGPLPCCSDNAVDVEPPEQPLGILNYQELCLRINPLEQSAEYGMELYSETILYVYNKLAQVN